MKECFPNLEVWHLYSQYPRRTLLCKNLNICLSVCPQESQNISIQKTRKNYKSHVQYKNISDYLLAKLDSWIIPSSCPSPRPSPHLYHDSYSFQDPESRCFVLFFAKVLMQSFLFWKILLLSTVGRCPCSVYLLVPLEQTISNLMTKQYCPVKGLLKDQKITSCVLQLCDILQRLLVCTHLSGKSHANRMNPDYDKHDFNSHAGIKRGSFSHSFHVMMTWLWLLRTVVVSAVSVMD